MARYAKSDSDFATEADLESERAIVGVLRRERPRDAVLGEEYGRSGEAAATRTWLVDPLCGTLNFAAETCLFSVNVALQADGQTVAAAVANPLFGDVVWTNGEGAFVRRDGIDLAAAPTPKSRLVDVNLDTPLDADADADAGHRLLADPAFRRAFGPRVSSTTLALTWVATGQRAAYLSTGEFRHDSVHFAAGIALNRAAGCVVTDVGGEPVHTGRGLVVAADPATHDNLLTLLAGYVANRPQSPTR